MVINHTHIYIYTTSYILYVSYKLLHIYSKNRHTPIIMDNHNTIKCTFHEFPILPRNFY